MIKPICNDIFFLSKKARKATINDINVAYDLLDTLKANSYRCVGMAANMIGEDLAIIVAQVGLKYLVMFNPVIISTKGEYETMEGCLSHSGERKCIRHQHIKVKYEDFNFKSHIEEYEGFTAQIIEHEVDHLKGILI